MICSGAVFLVAVYWFALKRNGSVNGEKKGLVGLARDINWDIVLFMLSIFIVVQGLEVGGRHKPAGVSACHGSKQASVGSRSFRAKHGCNGWSSFMNNWPMTILGLLSIHQAAVTGPALTNLVFSNIIGNNLGPHFFPLGSLAILMWLEIMRRKGVRHQPKRIPKVGAHCRLRRWRLPLLVLWVELNLLGFKLF